MVNSVRFTLSRTRTAIDDRLNWGQAPFLGAVNVHVQGIRVASAGAENGACPRFSKAFGLLLYAGLHIGRGRIITRRGNVRQDREDRHHRHEIDNADRRACHLDLSFLAAATERLFRGLAGIVGSFIRLAVGIVVFTRLPAESLTRCRTARARSDCAWHCTAKDGGKSSQFCEAIGTP
ncbi:MAG TPA: hypothetical protein VM223_14490, partial [Planctomycetota bacterium]|nr:hypothetical protein [Planctomycetota bacterium]